jgi:hypothetical protein
MDWDIATLRDKGEYGWLGALLAGGPCWFIDMPLSLFGDTLLLAVDLPAYHRAKIAKEFPSPLLDWVSSSAKQPDPAILADCKSYIEQLPDEQKKAIGRNDRTVTFWENGKGGRAMLIRFFRWGTEWEHILFYDDSNRRLKVLKYVGGRPVP